MMTTMVPMTIIVRRLRVDEGSCKREAGTSRETSMQMQMKLTTTQIDHSSMQHGTPCMTLSVTHFPRLKLWTL